MVQLTYSACVCAANTQSNAVSYAFSYASAADACATDACTGCALRAFCVVAVDDVQSGLQRNRRSFTQQICGNSSERWWLLSSGQLPSAS